jgi:hypothetical protein
MTRIKFMTGKVTVLEELEAYKAMNAGPVQMYAPSLNSRKTADPASDASRQGQSSASSPAAPAGPVQAGPPSDKERP